MNTHNNNKKKREREITFSVFIASKLNCALFTFFLNASIIRAGPPLLANISRAFSLLCANLAKVRIIACAISELSSCLPNISNNESIQPAFNNLNKTISFFFQKYSRV